MDETKAPDGAYGHTGDGDPTVWCPKLRHEDCDPLVCNLKTVTGADIVNRAYAYDDPIRHFQHSSATTDRNDTIPTPEGQTFHAKYQVGEDHWLHVFKVDRGGWNHVSAGPGFRFATNRANAYRWLKYGCGHWLDALALRYFAHDGLIKGNAPYAARYSCDACIAAGVNTKH